MSQPQHSQHKSYSPLSRAILICVIIMLSIYTWETARKQGWLETLSRPQYVASREEPGQAQQPGNSSPASDVTKNSKQEQSIVNAMKPPAQKPDTKQNNLNDDHSNQNKSPLTVVAKKPESNNDPRATNVSVDLRVDNLILKGKKLAAAGDDTAAVPLFSQAILAQPDRLDGYIHRAHAQGRLQNYKAAIVDYQYAIDRGRASFSIYYSLAQAYIHTKDYSRAIEFCTRAIQQDANIANCYITRGVAFQSLSNYQRALNDYTKAIELDASQPLAYRNRASVYSALNDPQRAAFDLRKAEALKKLQSQ